MKFKRIMAAVLSAALVISSAGSISYAAAPQNDVKTGVIKSGRAMKMVDIPAVYDVQAVSVDEMIKSPVISSIKGSKYYKSKWEKYGSWFYYNQLSDKQKKLFNALNTQCLKLLTGDAVIDNVMEDGNGDYIYYLDPIDYSDLGLSSKKAFEAVQFFKYSCPQYFFLSSYQYMDDVSGQLAMFIYKDFITPESREAALEKINETVDEWDSDISACDTDFEKVKMIHDKICERVSYNDHAYETNYVDDEKEYSQTIYSALAWDNKQTVCAGYSTAFAFVANKYGIDSVCVTSSDHQWNAVRIDDQWYIIDLTWDDAPDPTIPYWYIFFCRSSDAMDQLDEAIDAGNNESHTAEKFYKGYLPKFVFDSGATDTDAGEIYEPDSKAKPVTITVNKKNKKVSLKTKTKKATIYYTTDGSTPDPASTKCNKYTKAFKVKKGQVVRAIAVSSKYYDSKVTKKKVKF